MACRENIKSRVVIQEEVSALNPWEQKLILQGKLFLCSVLFRHPKCRFSTQNNLPVLFRHLLGALWFSSTPI